MSFASPVLEPAGSHTVTDVCTHKPKNINNCKRITERAHYCTVLLLQQYLLVVVNICNLEFQHSKTFNFCDENRGD